MPKILCVIQRPGDRLGYIDQLAQQGKYTLEPCYPSQGDPLPSNLTQYGAIVIGGGSMSVNDRHLPAIRAQLDWIPQVLQAHKPLLGICLGGQLLAKALGATVKIRADAHVDIGYRPIQPTEAGAVIFPHTLQTYHWNQEGFDLPSGAIALASGELFPNQAFRYGRAYGIQFHPEITIKMIQRWAQRSAPMLDRPGAQSIDDQLDLHQQHAQSVQSWLTQFLDQHLLQS